jgi:phage terminase large subunit-like protein
MSLVKDVEKSLTLDAEALQRENEEIARRVLLRCKNDIEYFGYFFFPHILSKHCAEFHKEIYKDLLDCTFYACAAPRGHAKSTIGLIIKPIHFALFDKTGDVALLSASESFIINEIVRVIKREFETNERIKAFFGDMKTAKWSETYFVLSNGVAFEAGGIGGQLRGGRRGLIALDDLESNESVASEEQRMKLRDRINKELIPKLLPNGQMIYFGTLISPLCYLKQILGDETNGWKKRIYRAYVDGVEAAGHELWSSMLPHAELQRRKSIMGTNSFMSEYMNNPISDATSAIKEEMIRYWSVLPSQLSVCLVIDPAYSEDSKADFKVCSVIGIDSSSNRYLIEYIRTRQPQGEFINAAISLFEKYKGYCYGFGVPSAGTESEFYRSITNRAAERKIYPPFMQLKNSFISASGEAKRNKKSRIIAALQPLFEAGKYYIGIDHIEAREELMLLNPTIDQEHDDLIDTMGYAEQILTPGFYERTPSAGEKPLEMAGKSTNYGMDE